MTRRIRKSIAIGMLASAALAIAPLHAARADESAVAAATILFDEGLKLMEAGKHAEACPKLARSQALAPSGGTLLALGECYEKTGRTASAWVAFREAATRAAAAGKRDAEASSLERARRLEPLFARLVITVPAATQAEGLEIRRDGSLVKEAELGVPVPIDPGTHEIRATAPHKVAFDKVIAANGGETIELPVPTLAPETAGADAPPSGETTAPPPVAPSSVGSGQRTVGVVVAAVGLASLVTGGVFGLLAKSKNDEALKSCPDGRHCTDLGLELTSQARTRALVSTILVVVGGTALAVGGIVFFTAPKATPGTSRLTVTPSVDLASAGGTATFVW